MEKHRIISNANREVKFEDIEWSGVYQLKPYNIWDGATRWSEGMYVGNDAIQVVGGTKALKGKVNFVRNTNKGYDVRKFKYNKNNKRGSYSNPKLMDGDLIYVGDSLFSSASDVINETTKPFIGLFSTYGLYKALTD